MERELVLRLKLRLPRTRWLVVSILVGLGAVTYAAVPNTFTAGDPLSATKLNDNFRALDVRNGYCGASSPVMPRLAPTNGYQGGAVLCATVVGCGPSAHICSAPDLVRHASSGGTTPDGWIATGTRSGSTADCEGFTSNTQIGMAWTRSAQPVEYSCGNAVTLPLLCCN